MDPQRLPQQGDQAAARPAWYHAYPDRGRSAVAELDSDAAGDGPWRVDTCLRFTVEASPRARFPLCHATLSRARFLSLGDISYRGALSPDWPAAAHPRHVPALLQVHGGCRAGGG